MISAKDKKIVYCLIALSKRHGQVGSKSMVAEAFFNNDDPVYIDYHLAKYSREDILRYCYACDRLFRGAIIPVDVDDALKLLKERKHKPDPTVCRKYPADYSSYVYNFYLIEDGQRIRKEMSSNTSIEDPEDLFFVLNAFPT